MCTNVCVGVTGSASGSGTTNSSAGSPASTIDDSDATAYEWKSGCSGSCGAGSSVQVTYALPVPTRIDSIVVNQYVGGSQRTARFTLTFRDGSTLIVHEGSPPDLKDALITVTGPWADVASVVVSLSAGHGSISGGFGHVKLYETRIAAAGLTRVPRCP
jgi:hypothetical protein